MFRVLLVGPNKGRDNSGDSFCAPPFGLYRIKFYIEKKLAGVLIDVMDPSIDDRTNMKGPYDVIGFSPLHVTFENDLGMFTYFKSRFPDALFVAGGIEVSFMEKKIFDYAPFDIIVLGEGEKTLTKIIEAARKKKVQFDGIRSIYWRSAGDEISFYGYGDQLGLNDFQDIYEAFDAGQVPYGRYWSHNAKLYRQPNWTEIRTVRAIFSNFCPFRCKFCASTNFISYSYNGAPAKAARLIALPIEDVVRFVQRVAAAWEDVETIIFDDDNLTMDPRYIEKLCRELIRLKRENQLNKNLSFISQGRPELSDRFKRDVLCLMREAGFRMIMYGVESFSESVSEYLGKKISRDRAIDAIEATRNAGIVPLIYIILFPPCIVKEDLIRTVDVCVRFLSKNSEISTTLLVMDTPGSALHYDSSLRRVFSACSTTGGSSIEKSDYIWPHDDELFDLGRDLLHNYTRYEESFKKEYDIQHIPSRIYSLIIFDAIYERLNLKDRRKKLHDILRHQIGDYR